MSKQETYRENAAESLELAHRVSSTRDKGRLLALAEAWLDLADRAEKLANRRTPKLCEHPLIKSKFKLDRSESE